MKKLKYFFTSGASYHGTVAAVITAVVIALVIIFNLIVGQMPTNIMQFDISGDEFYSVSDLSKEYIKNLEYDIDIIIITEAGTYDSRVNKFLDKYVALSDKLHLSEVDPAIYPSVLDKYDVTTNAIVVSCPEKNKQVSFGIEGFSNSIIVYDYAYYSYYQELYPVQFDGDGLLTSAINTVTTDANHTVYTMTGHGELELPESLTSIISKSNLTLGASPVNIETNGIPEDCELIICNTPKTDLTDKELDILLDYLANGGKVTMVYDQPELANFEKLINAYGLQTGSGYLADEKQYYSAYYSHYGLYCIYPVLSSENEITKDIANAALLLYSRGMSSIAPVRDSITVDHFMTSTEEAYTYDEAGYDFVAHRGQYTVGAVATEQTSGGEARLTVFSASSFIAAEIIDSLASLSNIDIFINAIVANFDDVTSITIPAKTLEISYNAMTNTGIWSIFFLGVIPGVMIIGGFIFWLKRRKR